MLTVLRRTRPNYVLCRCECPNKTEKEIQIGKLTCHWTKSCGCLQKRKASIAAKAVNKKRRQSMIGRIFDRLTVLAIDHWKPAGRKGRRYYYRVKCKCGTEKVVLGNSLVKHGTKSCGCLVHEGHPGYNRLPEGEASFRCCYGVYKHKAKKQNLSFELNHDQFRKLTASPCHYCGAPPSNVAKHPHRNGDFVYTGIDRVDNQQGYTVANTVPCCRQCNIAKNNHTLESFIAWATRVADRNRVVTLPLDTRP